MRLVMRSFVILMVCGLLAGTGVWGAETAPLRVAIVGLVHGHAEGFLANSAKPTDIKIVGISEPDRKLLISMHESLGWMRGCTTRMWKRCW